MTDAAPTQELISALCEATSFEAVAQSLLGACLASVHHHLSNNPLGLAFELKRGVVHLRPGHSYQGLVIRDAQTHAPTSLELLPSATIWRTLQRIRQPAAFDIVAGMVLRDGHAPEDLGWSAGLKESQARLLNRGATHILALPLVPPHDSAPVGMISIEVHCPMAVAAELPWDACLPDVTRMASLATPFLLLTPSDTTAPAQHDPLLPVIGKAMRTRIALLEVFVLQPETILLCGPTGTGKSRLARWCHTRSDRSDGPFVVVDLLTIPPNMQMAELFGWRKGSFTGATSTNQGHITAADGGTLFIDEIDKLSLEAQAGLLRLFEERRFRPLGEGARDRFADVRFVVGTNVDLAQAVRDGTFREDLYYRINVLPVHLPPLSDRSDEIPAWGEYMVTRRCEEAASPQSAALTDDAKTALARAEWPGNLRQLDNVVRRAFAIALAKTAPPSLHLSIKREHVELALSFETLSRTPKGLFRELEHCARLYASAAERALDASDPPLGLALAEAFDAMVLVAAESLTGDLAAACQLFGKDKLVANRNHHRFYERAKARLDTARHDLPPSLIDD